ncbi:serine/threonine-protein kinase [Candidatus Uabimicrobium sp. HlEnr_7]|uniref:serine/threonine-protein kinase n=1 Tax=Candidatus Uabimicrobium helgolandensis TaxID=3095367 RepID=UPI0035581711
MDAKDALFAHAAVSFGYISEEKLGQYAQELTVRRKKNKTISLENFLVENKVFSKEKIAEIYSRISQNLQVNEEPHSKTLTMCEDQPQIEFTIAPGSMSRNAEPESSIVEPQHQESIFLGNAIGQKLGRYVITGRLGRGGMGIVYKAEDETLKRTVAIKVLINSQIDTVHSERFVREAQTVASLNHPNIMQIHDISKLGNNYYLVVEYIEGEPLSHIIRAQSPLDVDRALLIVKKVAEGLDAAHKLKIIHRDIKPANIMVSKGSEPKVTDFGLAKMPSAASLSQSGQVVGTPSYMAPEQVEGKPVDNRSDLYSLGITLYEMLCANLPFKGDNLYNIMMAHVHKNPVDIGKYNSKIDEALASIVAKMMAKNPEDRFQNGKQIVEAITGYMEQDIKKVYKINKTPKKKKSLVKVVFLVLLFAGASVFSGVKLYPNHELSKKVKSNWQIVKKKANELWKSRNTKTLPQKYVVDFKVSDPFFPSQEFLISIMREEKNNFSQVKNHTTRLVPGKYVYKIEKQGYETIIKPFEIKKDMSPLHIEEKMKVLPRKIDFSIVDLQTEKTVPTKKIIVNNKALQENVITPGKVVIRLDFEDYESILLEKMILPSTKIFTVKVKLALVAKKTIVKEITYELLCTKRESDSFIFLVDGNQIDSEKIKMNAIDEKRLFRISLLKSAKKIRVEHDFYFSEQTLNAKQERIIIALQNIDYKKFVTYLKQLESGKTLEKVAHFVYKDDFQFSRELVSELIDLLKKLKFKEKYQYKYRSSLINELRLKKIEDNNGK